MAGRHRAPTAGVSATGRGLTALGLATAVTGPLLIPDSGAASAQAADATTTLRAIARCESGGNPTAQNPHSSASGTYQFLDSSWAAYGGARFSARAKLATPAQQTEVALHALVVSGTAPWNASRACWSRSVEPLAPGQVSTAPAKPPARRPAKHPAKHPTRHPVRPAGSDLGRRAADGTGVYVCDIAHLAFEACDPDNLGELVHYPPYDRPTSGPLARAAELIAEGSRYTVRPGDTLSGLAARSGYSWPALYARNRAAVGDDPDRLLPGTQLEL